MNPITTATLVATTLLLVALSLNVSRLRLHHKISAGDGGHRDLAAAVRAHGNLVEQWPLLLLLWMAESRGAAGATLVAIAGVVVLARLLHAAGMLARLPLLRRAGHVLSLVCLLSLAVTLGWSLLRG
ncbi:MAG: MAPEG family protein [Rubrivivax sp.]|jgi:uncharacterized membrane protein YecN with MAPEG domain|nr:MAPEG family protein [Rubrivivax sp.]